MRQSFRDVITSRDNRWLKMFRTALRGTGPKGNEPIGVEGAKLVEEAVLSGLDTEALLLTDSSERLLEVILRAASESATGIPWTRILRTTNKLFVSVAGTETPQGVAALFQQRPWSFDDVLRGAPRRDGSLRGDPALVVVLAGVQDPGNVGTIVRSAEAFGATGVISTRGTADPWSPKALRASAGSALRLPLLRGWAIPVLLAQLRMAQVKVYAAASRPGAGAGSFIVGQADLRAPAAIFIGNEGAGLPGEVVRAADVTVSIPTNEVESLNAGVAASIVLYEASRQRGLH
jgi:TrmH family RNA methyltransferase